MTRVVVIDDDMAMTETLKMILEPKAFEVVAVNSGEEGVESVMRSQPDVVVLDLFMPGMDGWEVTRAIRKFSQVPILVVSAFSKPSMVVQALDDGADDYLAKPISGSVLIAKINNLARRGKNPERLLTRAQAYQTLGGKTS